MALNFPSSPRIKDSWIDRASGATFRWDGTSWLIYRIGTPWRITPDLIPYLNSIDGSTVDYSLIDQPTIGQTLVYNGSKFANKYNFRTQAVFSVESSDLTQSPFNMTLLNSTHFIGDLTNKTFGGAQIVVGNRYLLTHQSHSGIYVAISNQGLLQLTKAVDSAYWLGGELVYDYHTSNFHLAKAPAAGDQQTVANPQFSLISLGGGPSYGDGLTIIDNSLSVKIDLDSTNTLSLTGDGLYSAPSYSLSFSSVGQISSDQALRQSSGAFSNISPSIVPYDSTIYAIVAENGQWLLDVAINGTVITTIPSNVLNLTTLNVESGDLISAYFKGISSEVTNPTATLYITKR